VQDATDDFVLYITIINLVLQDIVLEICNLQKFCFAEKNGRGYFLYRNLLCPVEKTRMFLFKFVFIFGRKARAVKINIKYPIPGNLKSKKNLSNA